MAAGSTVWSAPGLMARAAALAAVLVFWLANLANAADCNPTKQTCPAVPALGTTATGDWTQSIDHGPFEFVAGFPTFDAGTGLVFTLRNATASPTIRTAKYIFFGRVDVTLQAAPGVGIATSLTLLSDDLDEIDMEWLGAYDNQVQSNYFSKGDVSVYDRAATHNVSSGGSLTAKTHTYSIVWSREQIEWLVDGAVVRTVRNDGSGSGSGFPQTPMRVSLGAWVAGRQELGAGTVEWAGGLADFSKGPFSMTVKSFSIADDATGAAQYSYADTSGTYQGIRVEDASGALLSSSSSSSSSSSTADQTGSSSTSQTGASTRSSSSSAPTNGTSLPGEDGSGSGSGSGEGSGLGAGAIAGIVVGIVAAAVIIAGLAFVVLRRKRLAGAPVAATDDVSGRPELGGQALEKHEGKPELDGQHVGEMDGADVPHELNTSLADNAPAAGMPPQELPPGTMGHQAQPGYAPGHGAEAYELPADWTK
ncbi:concanavalin A-like lectin/glucanase domain-containing protein [Lasiosphaeria ovina]|uniref:Concanavalin A-like lectin/glucanase domain-containing protein n=1 Tax=Lasiosphaeria ovina TaxID=92902 RepID=A0AAE0N9A2_9PEZI|nr:concanavalin A-like lectin/glucanase domain-containing protein [Lasiosphaeria ovina]